MRDDICAVIHGHMRAVGNRRLDVTIVGGIVLLDGKSRDAFMLDEGGSHVILGTERIEAQSRTSAPPAFNVMARLAVSVVTCKQAVTHALEGLLPFEPFSNEPQDRHVASAHSILSLPWSASLMSLTS